MRRFIVIAALFLGATCVTAAAAGDPDLPPAAAPAPQVSLAWFEEQLTPYGHWSEHPQWGEVWKPDGGPDFRPYFNGYWQFTSDYGWLWVSNEPFGDIVYHYGRWIYDPTEGWLWVPGYVWGPGWVAWRQSDEYVGWLPMPPGYSDYATLTPQTTPTTLYSPESLYGYQNFYGAFGNDAFSSLWVFVPGRDFGRRDRRPYIVDRSRIRDIYRGSQDSTHYDVDRDHDRVVNHSLDKDALERAAKRGFAPSPASEFLRPRAPLTTLSQGQQLSTIKPPQWRPFGSADNPGSYGSGYPAPVRLHSASGLTSPDISRPQIGPGFNGPQPPRMGGRSPRFEGGPVFAPGTEFHPNARAQMLHNGGPVSGVAAPAVARPPTPVRPSNVQGPALPATAPAASAPAPQPQLARRPWQLR